MRRLLAAAAASACMMIGSGPGGADDVLKLAVGAPNNWDTCIRETMQAVISGSVDIGIAAGTAAVMGAFAKGAPVRILAAGTTGTSDLYWYVPAGSPIPGFKDLNGKTVGYSTNGASTHTTLLALIKHFGVSAQPVASGAAAVTYTQAMSGQIDVGWASPPFGLEALQDGKTRLIARGSDASSTRDQTVRVHIINANVLVQRRDAIARFMRAYRETYDFLYDNPQGVELYAPYGKVTEPLAIRIRDEFLPKPAMLPDRISGLDAITQDAITFKILPAPLSRQQLDELIQIPPRAP